MEGPVSGTGTEDTTHAPIRFRVEPARGGFGIGVATLDSPSSLNALSLEMIDALDAQLIAWRNDTAVAAVWLDASSDKAFCAGGDLQVLYTAMREAGNGRNAFAEKFFSHEYRLNHRIFNYPKPFVSWMHGIVMGGGVGVGCAARHRVVTERSMMAMPEITIGLFPDVGGTWYLGRMPGGIGRYLGLTGARMNAADAIFAGMADLPIQQDARDDVFAGLAGLDWQGEAAGDNTLLRRHLNAAADWPLVGSSALAPRFADLTRIAGSATPSEAADAIAAYAETDEWAAPHAAALASGAPSSVLMTWALQERLVGASFAEVLRTEYAAALGCSAHGDFMEGIRALIIEKDRKPRWEPASLADAGADLIDELLRPRWPGEHPLADLETNT